MEEERVDEGAAVALVVGGAGAGVDHHAGGLVDDGEVLVFVEDVEGDVFGDGVERLRGWGAPSISMASPPCELLLGLGGLAVDADLAGFDEELDAGAADVGDGLGEVLVEAEAGGGGVGGEGADAVCVGVGVVFVEVEDGDWGRAASGSTPRVATYSARTEWWRWPLGSMFLDGMGDQLSLAAER